MNVYKTYVMWCRSTHLAPIQVAFYTADAVEYTRPMVQLCRTLANSDPVFDIRIKYEEYMRYLMCQ